jgi:hypothetical protein
LVRLENNKLEANRYLGKSFTDLNALQLALITSSESMVITLLNQLKMYATPQELKLFINHIWGQGNSSLHLAVFLKRHLVVKTLMDLGCQPDHLNARKKSATDCCYYGDQRMIDLLSLHKYHPETTTHVPMTTVPTTTSVIQDVADKKKNDTVVIDNTMTTDLQQQQPIKKEVTVDIYSLQLMKLVQQQHHHQLAANKMILPVYNEKNITKTTVQQKPTIATQYIALTQLKKPPDIHSFFNQHYVPFMVTASC